MVGFTPVYQQNKITMVLHLSFPREDIFIPLNKSVVISMPPIGGHAYICINSMMVYCPEENCKRLKDLICSKIAWCYANNESLTIEVNREDEIGSLVYPYNYFDPL